MVILVWNLLLAIAWATFWGEVSATSLVVGFVLGYLALWLLRPLLGPTAYFRKMQGTWRFVLFFLWELVLANLRIAYDVITPTHHMRPGVVAVPLEARTDVEITALANLISLTPGTLSLDVSADRRVLYLHVMYLDDVDAFRREIKENLERPLLELCR
jgi:multicomponent Na+:H+ antiporter subunit E